MYKECRHIKPNGSKCRVAALKEKPYCYFHVRLHGIVRSSAAPPLPTSKKNWRSLFWKTRRVQIALSEVVSASPENGSTTNAPDSLVYALQVASSNAKNMTDIVADQQVRDRSENEEGEELGPEATTYEPNDEEYRDAYGEPSVAQLLLNEVKRYRDEAKAEENTEKPERNWSGDPLAGKLARH